MSNNNGWLPIESAPKKQPDGDMLNTPRILLRFPRDEQSGYAVSVGYWDWYYSPGCDGCTHGVAWIEPVSGEQLFDHYGKPDRWQPLPSSPAPLQAAGVGKMR